MKKTIAIIVILTIVAAITLAAVNPDLVMRYSIAAATWCYRTAAVAWYSCF